MEQKMTNLACVLKFCAESVQFLPNSPSCLRGFAIRKLHA